MTNKISTKRALLSSIMAMLLCLTMLVGTTFAWFTDSVTSGGNVIQSGTLDVARYWAEGNEDPTAVSKWKDASTGAIFNNDKWEPGYIEAKHIKIANEGTLALKYQMRILANGVISELADVIDVYYFAEAKQLSRADFVNAKPLGTLAEVLKNNVTVNDEITPNANAISNVVKGSLEKDKSTTITLAFKMRDLAGDEYQNLSIGADFSIQILATQYTSENDSFDNQYDGGADFAPQEVPAAMVYAMSQNTVSNIVLVDANKNPIGNGLDVGYSFQPSETYEQALASEYSWAHADFYVYADATVPANSIMLAGYYSLFGDFIGIDSNSWIGLSNDGFDVQAGEANGIRLLKDGMSGISIAYNEICNYGNDGDGFLCGAADLTGVNEGTTLTVELRLYKTYSEEEAEALGYGKTKNQETGECITVGKFEYTFDDPTVEYLADGSRVRYGENGKVTLEGVDKATVTNGTYYIPDGVTTLNGEVFTQNANITTVVIPDTITDFGATGVSATGASSGAFKNSAVETVVLPEGMTEIPAAAFNGAKNLKSVNIPASVETIGVNAFRQTALETLTVPATVDTISYGAFRDMTSLTTVTIEGDVHIPDYAFRGCSALRTVYINGENATVGSNMAFANASSNNPGTNNIKFYVKSESVAAQVRACMGVGTDFWIYVDDVEVTVVKNDTELLNAIKNPINETSTTILLADGTYSKDLNLTIDAMGQAQCDNFIFKAAGDNVTYAGTITLGYYESTVGAANWEANVTFEGITFQHATVNTHSINVQSVNSANFIDCHFVGNNREYGITCARGNSTGTSKIVGCTFENAGMQLLGNFATDLVIDYCTFADSCVNVQGGNGVTVQNCVFNNTLTETNIDDSFYAIRSNSTPITVKGCKINIDSELTDVVTTAQAKWYLLANRGTTNWTVTDVEITITDAALAQTQLQITACTSTGVINATNLTVNGVQR